MSLTFTKLFSSITESTIWFEPHATRLVWITMLAMSDRNGLVFGSVPGLAHRARVTVDECRDALERLKSPDPDSRTKAFDGVRIADVDGGWELLNYAKYRAIQDAQNIRESKRDYMRRQRAVDPVSGIDVPLSKLPSISASDSSSGSGSPEKKKRKPRTRKPLCAIPSDFAPTAAHAALATELGVSLADELPKFIEHHSFKATMGRDWNAALRLWLRNAKTFSARSGPGKGHSQGRSRNHDAIEYAIRMGRGEV